MQLKANLNDVRERLTKGRPADYCDETAQTICILLMEGLTLKEICKLEGMPCTSSVHVWLGRYPVFMELYIHAKSIQLESRVDGIYDFILNNNDLIVDKDGNERLDQGKVQLKKLYVDTVKWHTGKEVARYRHSHDESDKSDMAGLISKLMDRLPN